MLLNVPLKLHKYSQWKFGAALGMGALIALVLCVQCVRTYLYTDSVLVPQQAGHEAARQAGALSAAARSSGITDPRLLAPALDHVFEAVADRAFWMRVLDLDGKVISSAGSPEGASPLPLRWWERVEKHENLGRTLDTSHGKALVLMLPLRVLRAPHLSDADPARSSEPHSPGDWRRPGYVLEVAISLKAVAGAFSGLRENLVVGLIASLALLAAVTVIGLRAPHYFRGKYLEGELQLAKRVQSDLQPNPRSVFPHVEFAACAAAADHIGGDFYDIFGTQSGQIAMVLGDVSGKGVPAALLVSVLHGAIRSSTALQHERACEQINRMLCERTACERFATLFWAVFDSATCDLRYVNAGHAAPMLVRQDGRIERLDEGGPVLGLLPDARFAAGVIKIKDNDRLIVYSDRLTEASDRDDREFGESGIAKIIAGTQDDIPGILCERIMNKVTAFASDEASQDDRTLIVVRFSALGATARSEKSSERSMAVA